MKETVLVILLAALFAFAGYLIFKDFGKTHRIVVIDGCEYIQTITRYGGSLVHSESCKNPKHND